MPSGVVLSCWARCGHHFWPKIFGGSKLGTLPIMFLANRLKFCCLIVLFFANSFYFMCCLDTLQVVSFLNRLLLPVWDMFKKVYLVFCLSPDGSRKLGLVRWYHKRCARSSDSADSADSQQIRLCVSPGIRCWFSPLGGTETPQFTTTMGTQQCASAVIRWLLKVQL